MGAISKMTEVKMIVIVVNLESFVPFLPLYQPVNCSLFRYNTNNNSKIARLLIQVYGFASLYE